MGAPMGTYSLKSLAFASVICSSWAMHSVLAPVVSLAALFARGLVSAGNNNNRANNNANHWRARA